MDKGVSTKSWTADMIRFRADGFNRHESVDGELLLTPTPSRVHQRAVCAILIELDAYVDAQRLGEVLVSPSEIMLQEALVQPDVFVQGLLNGYLPTGWNNRAPLLLAVEVISAYTARWDRTVKRRLFDRAGIPDYWIVDTDAQVVERWRAGDRRPEILSEKIIWRPQDASGALDLDLVSLFGRIKRERP